MKPWSRNRNSVSRLNQAGFGLFDVLLAVGDLFVAYSLATAVINQIHGSWDDDELQEIAARMVTTTRYAEQAGVDLVVPNDLDATIETIASGRTAEKGPFAGQFYGVRNLDEVGRREVRDFLILRKGELALASAGEGTR